MERPRESDEGRALPLRLLVQLLLIDACIGAERPLPGGASAAEAATRLKALRFEASKAHSAEGAARKLLAAAAANEAVLWILADAAGGGKRYSAAAIAAARTAAKTDPSEHSAALLSIALLCGGLRAEGAAVWEKWRGGEGAADAAAAEAGLEAAGAALAAQGAALYESYVEPRSVGSDLRDLEPWKQRRQRARLLLDKACALARGGSG